MRASAFALMIIALGGPLHAAPASPPPRIVMVVAPKDFTDREYTDPRAVFEKAGAVVRVASITRGPAQSHGGQKLHVDLAVSEITLDGLDALVIVGGAGALAYLADDEALRGLVISAFRSRKVVAAICVAPAVLARAGILRNLSATCYPDPRVVTLLKRNGAAYLEKSVVVADRVLTANGPDAATDFGARIMEMLKAGTR